MIEASYQQVPEKNPALKAGFFFLLAK